MVQLGAIVAAEPKLRSIGAKVVMHVVGANADASVWIFDCVAIESVATGAGTVSALKFVREPREPYDTLVQVWLDPERHYLPVRATQKSGPSDEGFELRLQSVDTHPLTTRWRHPILKCAQEVLVNVACSCAVNVSMPPLCCKHTE